jgi:hypothetical protein
MDKLVCDHCGFELTEKNEINLALDGMDAWQDAVRSRGEEPRGVFPCKFYFQCKGEMVFVKARGKSKR